MNAALSIAIVSTLCAALDRRSFAAALARLKGIVAAKPTNPALANVLIESIDDALVLTGTDGSVFVRVVVGADVVSHDVLLTLHRRLADICKGPNARLELASDHVTACGVTHRIASMPPTEFPPVPTPQGNVYFTLLRPTLARALAATVHAMSVDDTRPHLSSMLIERRGRELRFVAVDGHRLAMATLPDDGTEFSALVGRTTIEELHRMIATPGGLVRLRREGDRVWFVCGDEWVSGPIVDATFPAYETVIPAAPMGQVTLDRDELRTAVTALVPHGKAGVSITFDQHIWAAKLSTGDDDGNVAEAPIAATFEGVLPKSIGINGQYLRELVAALGADDHHVSFDLGGELDPIRVNAHATTFVVMPMRL